MTRDPYLILFIIRCKIKLPENYKLWNIVSESKNDLSRSFKIYSSYFSSKRLKIHSFLKLIRISKKKA